MCREDCHVENLFRALVRVKEVLKTPRIQLHFFGLYLTVQNKSFRITPVQNRSGMILAATVAAGKAGTGDVLSGMIGGFLAQKVLPANAAILAAYIHGLAADIYAGEYGEYSLLASDLLSYIPLAFKKVLR